MMDTTKVNISLLEDATYCFVCNCLIDLHEPFEVAQFASKYKDYKWNGTLVFPVCTRCKQMALEHMVGKAFRERFSPIEGEWEEKK